MPERFIKVKFCEKNACWSGLLYSGGDLPFESGRKIAELCRNLMDGKLDMIKDRPKIKAGVGNGFFVKQYRLPGITAQLCRRFRRGRAVHSLYAAEAVRAAGVNTPQVAAAFEYRCNFRICDFLITDELPENSLSASHYLVEQVADRVRAWQFMINDILPEECKLHQAGIIHGDLNLRNLYRTGTGETGVIDLDGAELRQTPLPAESREKELARLLSGFLLLIRNCDMNETVSAMVDRYRELCAVECDREKIFRRTEYLLNRNALNLEYIRGMSSEKDL